MAGNCDLVIVVGSPNSSNSNRLREVASNRGVDAYLVDDAEQIDPKWLANRKHVGVTAGASAPEAVLHRLEVLGAVNVSQLAGSIENIVFSIPRELQQPAD
jgi:4-hydroxy-3-methylbut-2-enyl diphosphate reductase